MRRREFLASIASAAICSPLPLLAQKAPARIGWLVFGDETLGPTDRSLKEALARIDLADGRPMQISYRYAQNDITRLNRLAEELAGEKVDLLLGLGGDVIRSLYDASKGKTPVVGGTSDGPVRAGLADSLAKPGRNFTGVTFLTDEMAAKRMELLKEVAPEANRVAIIFNPQHFDDELTFAKRGAASLGITVTTHPIETRGELDGALKAARAKQADSMFVIPSRLTRAVAASIASFGLEYRIPVMAAWREFVTVGALLSYGPSVLDETKRVAGYVQKVLNGARPADLPIEQPVKFELVVNLKTARAIGLTIGRDFLLRVDDLIE